MIDNLIDNLLIAVSSLFASGKYFVVVACYKQLITLCCNPILCTALAGSSLHKLSGPAHKAG